MGTSNCVPRGRYCGTPSAWPVLEAYIYKNTTCWPATAYDVTTGATPIYGAPGEYIILFFVFTDWFVWSVHSGKSTFFSLSWRALARRLRLCVDPCPRYLTPDDSHNLCIFCLGKEHARDVLEGKICVHCELFLWKSSALVSPSFQGKRDSRLLPAIRGPPLPRHWGELNHGVRSWIWPMS